MNKHVGYIEVKLASVRDRIHELQSDISGMEDDGQDVSAERSELVSLFDAEADLIESLDSWLSDRPDHREERESMGRDW